MFITRQVPRYCKNSSMFKALSAIRLNSNIAESVLKDIEENANSDAPSANQPKSRLAPLHIYLNYVSSERGAQLPLEEVIKRVETAMRREFESPEFNSATATRKNNNSFHRVFNYLIKTNPEQAESATIYKFLTVMKDYQIANVSHFNRAMEAYLKEKKAEDALSLYVESLQYESELSDKSAYWAVSRPNNIHSTAYLAYLLSCYNREVDPEWDTFKQLSGQASTDILEERNVRTLLNGLEFEKNFKNFAVKYLRKHKMGSADPNDDKYVAEGLKSAHNHHITGLEKSYNNIMQAAQHSGIEITEDTYRKMMHMFSAGLKPARAQQIWNTMVEKIGTPKSVDTWNELLYSFSKVGRKSSTEAQRASLAKLESTFNYIDTNITANATTYNYLVAGYVANGEFEKAFELIQELSTSGKKGIKITDEIISTYLIGLSKAKKMVEANKLLSSFISSAKYKPDIKVLNNFLAYYNKHKAYSSCDDIISLMKKYEVAPDLVTYSMMIDIFVKNSSGASAAKLDQILEQTIAEMKASGINFSNPVTLSSIVIRLATEGSLDSVRLLIEYMDAHSISKSFMLYVSVIHAESTHGDIDIAKRLFQESISKGIKPNVPYYNNIINGCLRSGKWSDAMSYFKSLQADKSLTPNFYTYYYLLNFCNNARDINKDATQAVIDDLGKLMESSSISLGRQLPRILNQLEKKGVKMPESLASSPQSTSQ